MEDTAAGTRWAGLTTELAAGPELSLALHCISWHVRWVPVLGWHWCWGNTGAGYGDCSESCTESYTGQGDMGLALVGDLTLGGCEGTSAGAVMRPGTCMVC